MTDENMTDKNQAQSSADSLKSWMMVALTAIFVLLYVAALFGMIKPLADISTITRLEPIIFVIIGYYFGRLPAQSNENALKNEIGRQSQKADAAQQIKEKAQQEREVLEEKIRNARIALIPQMTDSASEKLRGSAISPESAGTSNEAIETAAKILDS